MVISINSPADTNKLHNIFILVVDDDKKFARLIKNVLLSFGFKQVHITYSGKEAIRLLAHGKYDFIITDWKMEPVNGYELVEYIRNDPSSPDFFMPILMISGMAERHNIEDARDIGITEFLAKPFSVEMLKQRIVAIFENPREFIFSGDYTGPNRRRRNDKISSSKERRRNN